MQTERPISPSELLTSLGELMNELNASLVKPSMYKRIDTWCLENSTAVALMFKTSVFSGLLIGMAFSIIDFISNSKSYSRIYDDMKDLCLASNGTISDQDLCNGYTDKMEESRWLELVMLCCNSTGDFCHDDLEDLTSDYCSIYGKNVTIELLVFFMFFLALGVLFKLCNPNVQSRSNYTSIADAVIKYKLNDRQLDKLAKIISQIKSLLTNLSSQNANPFAEQLSVLSKALCVEPLGNVIDQNKMENIQQSLKKLVDALQAATHHTISTQWNIQNRIRIEDPEQQSLTSVNTTSSSALVRYIKSCFKGF